MTRKKHLAREALSAASDRLSEEIAEGKWDSVGANTKPIRECTAILEELECRCPGHSHEEYADAITRSLWTNR